MATHDYIAQKLYDEHSTRLCAEAAAYRFARPTVRRPRVRPSLPWWRRLGLGGQPHKLRPA
jgi:hypothetical protein